MRKTLPADSFPKPNPVPLLYFSGCLIASFVFLATGSNIYFKFAHLGMAAAAGVIVLMSDFLRLLLKDAFFTLHGRFFVFFLIYYILLIALYPDPEIAYEHWRYLTVSILPGFLTGIIAFGRIRFTPALQALRIPVRRLTGPIHAGILLFYAALSAASAWLVWNLRRDDIFLISARFLAIEDVPYQLICDYRALAFMIFACLALHYLFAGPDHTRSRALWAATLVLLAAVFLLDLLFIALIGSNKGLLLVFATFALCIYALKPREFFLRKGFVKLQRALLAGLLLTAVIVAVFAALFLVQFEFPMLRIFNFEQPGNILSNSSLVSRIEIFLNCGLDQLALNPIFGDLGAEYGTCGKGYYLHSLLSVQSHMGIVGSVCLSVFLLASIYRLVQLPGKGGVKVILWPILSTAIVAAFYSWIVFWFLAGALFSPDAGAAGPAHRTAN
jgi:hypothetical protein